MIGRSSHCLALRRGLGGAAGGAATVIVVEGDPGVGKSTLLDFAADQRAVGSLLLRASGHLTESELPYAGLHQLISPIVGSLGDLPPPQAAALSRALALESGAPGDRLATASALLRVLTQAAVGRPVVVVVDDFGWLDPSTKQALVFVARRIEADAVAMVLGVRRGTAPELDGIGDRLEVGALRVAEARELLRLHFPDLSAAVAIRVVERAAGLPLALTEIPAELSVAQRTGRAPLPPKLPIGSFIEGLYASRLARLGDRARLALLLASFEDLDPPVLTDALARCGLGTEDLDEPERGHLVRLTAGRCVFAHPTVRAAIQDVATARELTVANDALARCFAHDPVRYAVHVQGMAAVQDREVEAAQVAAARQAARQGGLAESAAWWEAAARRTHDQHTRVEHLAEAAQGYVRSGSGPRALGVLDELVASATEDVARARWQGMRVVTHLWTEGSPPPDSPDLAARAADLAARPGQEDAGIDLLLALATAWLVWGDYRAARELTDRVRATRPDEALTVGQLLLCDIVDVQGGAPEAGLFLRSRWDDGLSDERLGDPSMPRIFAGMTLIWLDEVDACERIARRLREILDTHGDVAAARQAGPSLLAQVWERRGDWERAALEHATAQAAAIDSDFTAPYPAVTLRFAYLRAQQGRDEECRDLTARAMAAARQSTPSLEHLEACVLGMLHLTCGRYTESAAVLARAAALEQDVSTGVGYSSRLVDQFEALWHLGRTEELREDVAAVEAAAQRSGRPTALAAVARCRALVAPPDEFDGGFARAVAGYEEATQAFEVARTHLLWGRRLRRARRKGDARVQLREAHRRFDDLGAPAWLERCRSELAACGERRIADPRVAGPLAALTPREFEIAQVAVTGASNAEVAEKLFISLRTVEYHLSNVYRKVGVANRQGLRALFPANS